MIAVFAYQSITVSFFGSSTGAVTDRPSLIRAKMASRSVLKVGQVCNLSVAATKIQTRFQETNRP